MGTEANKSPALPSWGFVIGEALPEHNPDISLKSHLSALDKGPAWETVHPRKGSQEAHPQHTAHFPLPQSSRTGWGALKKDGL